MPMNLNVTLDRASIRVLVDMLRLPSDALQARIHVYEEDRSTGMAFGEASVDGYTLSWFGPPKMTIPEDVLIREIEHVTLQAVSQFLAGARNRDFIAAEDATNDPRP